MLLILVLLLLLLLLKSVSRLRLYNRPLAGPTLRKERLGIARATPFVVAFTIQDNGHK